MPLDTSEENAEILCSTSCHIENLILHQINDEHFHHLQKNIVKLNDTLKADRKLTFENMALIGPLHVKTINNHKVESLINWTREVVLDQNVKVIK